MGWKLIFSGFVILTLFSELRYQNLIIWCQLEDDSWAWMGSRIHHDRYRAIWFWYRSSLNTWSWTFIFTDALDSATVQNPSGISKDSPPLLECNLDPRQIKDFPPCCGAIFNKGPGGKSFEIPLMSSQLKQSELWDFSDFLLFHFFLTLVWNCWISDPNIGIRLYTVLPVR